MSTVLEQNDFPLLARTFYLSVEEYKHAHSPFVPTIKKVLSIIESRMCASGCAAVTWKPVILQLQSPNQCLCSTHCVQVVKWPFVVNVKCSSCCKITFAFSLALFHSSSYLSLTVSLTFTTAVSAAVVTAVTSQPEPMSPLGDRPLIFFTYPTPHTRSSGYN